MFLIFCDDSGAAVGQEIDAELPVGAADLRIVLLRERPVDQRFSGAAVHHLASVVSQHVAAHVKEPYIFSDRNDAGQRTTGSQHHMDALCCSLVNRLDIPRRDFFPGVGEGAVEVEGDDFIFLIIVQSFRRLGSIDHGGSFPESRFLI